MHVAMHNEPKAISIHSMRFPAARCGKCGAKMYPTSLLKPHLTHHRRRERWFTAELRQLQYTIAHMRDFA